MTTRYDIVGDGERLIAGLSEFDALEHVRFWTSQGVAVSMLPALAWHRETGRHRINRPHRIACCIQGAFHDSDIV